MNQLEHNGPGFKYQLTVKERGSTRSDAYNIDRWQNYTISIPCNKVYTPFLVKLQAKNSIGDAKEDAEEKTLYSYEDSMYHVCVILAIIYIPLTYLSMVHLWCLGMSGYSFNNFKLFLLKIMIVE